LVLNIIYCFDIFHFENPFMLYLLLKKAMALLLSPQARFLDEKNALQNTLEDAQVRRKRILTK
jgi:hypothetical protein